MRTAQLRAALVAVFVLGAGVPAHAFDVYRHFFMTGDALDEGLDGSALALVRLGVIYPDLVDCARGAYCDGWKRALTRSCEGLVKDATGVDEAMIPEYALDHFDDDAIETSAKATSQRVAKARAILLAAADQPDPESVAGALLMFGAALHALQDFYAHSTYLECALQLEDPYDPYTVALWNGSREQPLVKQGKHACGTVVLAVPPVEEDETPCWQTGPASSVESIEIDGLRTGHFLGKGECCDPRQHICHDALNKDSPAARQGQRVFRGVGKDREPRDYSYYEAVSGQSIAALTNKTVLANVASIIPIPLKQDHLQIYRDSGLAVRHSQQAFNSLVTGKPLFASIQLARDGSGLEVDKIRLRSPEGEDDDEEATESEADKIRRVLAAATDDPALEGYLQEYAGEGFATCLVEKDWTEQFLNEWRISILDAD